MVKAHVVGLSIGATLGQVFALDYSDRLHSLSLMRGAALDVDFVGNIGQAFSGEKIEFEASDFQLREQRCIDHAGTWALSSRGLAASDSR